MPVVTAGQVVRAEVTDEEPTSAAILRRPRHAIHAVNRVRPTKRLLGLDRSSLGLLLGLKYRSISKWPMLGVTEPKKKAHFHHPEKN